MNEKDFAKMPISELEAHCKKLQEELERARWFLRNRKSAKLGDAGGIKTITNSPY